MTVEKIKQLLIEAATADTNRLIAIHAEFIEASYDGGTTDTDTAPAGLLALMDALFVGMYEADKTALLSMWPVFALICCERNGNYLAPISVLRGN